MSPADRLIGWDAEAGAIDGSTAGRELRRSYRFSAEPAWAKRRCWLPARDGPAGRSPVLRTVGVEAEAQLPFVGLHQVVDSALDHAEMLPSAER